MTRRSSICARVYVRTIEREPRCCDFKSDWVCIAPEALFNQQRPLNVRLGVLCANQTSLQIGELCLCENLLLPPAASPHCLLNYPFPGLKLKSICTVPPLSASRSTSDYILQLDINHSLRLSWLERCKEPIGVTLNTKRMRGVFRMSRVATALGNCKCTR